MAKSKWPNRNIAARSFHQLRRFCHLINVDKVFGTHNKGFGDDPFIMPVDPTDVPVAFSAWAYAEERCQVLGAKTPLVFPPEWENVTADQVGTAISIVGVEPSKR